MNTTDAEGMWTRYCSGEGWPCCGSNGSDRGTSRILQEGRGVVLQQQVRHAVMPTRGALMQRRGAVRPAADVVHVRAIPRELQGRHAETWLTLHCWQQQTACMHCAAHQLHHAVVALGRSHEQRRPLPVILELQHARPGQVLPLPVEVPQQALRSGGGHSSVLVVLWQLGSSQGYSAGAFTPGTESLPFRSVALCKHLTCRAAMSFPLAAV